MPKEPVYSVLEQFGEGAISLSFGKWSISGWTLIRLFLSVKRKKLADLRAYINEVAHKVLPSRRGTSKRGKITVAYSVVPFSLTHKGDFSIVLL